MAGKGGMSGSEGLHSFANAFVDSLLHLVGILVHFVLQRSFLASWRHINLRADGWYTGPLAGRQYNAPTLRLLLRQRPLDGDWGIKA